MKVKEMNKRDHQGAKKEKLNNLINIKTYWSAIRNKKEAYAEFKKEDKPGKFLLTKKIGYKWRFQINSGSQLIMWTFLVFLGIKIIIFPLIEGLYNYYHKCNQYAALEKEYQAKLKQLAVLKKTKAYMKTNHFIEKRGHQLGLIKDNEMRMILIERQDFEAQP